MALSIQGNGPITFPDSTSTTSTVELLALKPVLSANSTTISLAPFAKVDGTAGFTATPYVWTSRPFLQSPVNVSFQAGSSSSANITAPGSYSGPIFAVNNSTSNKPLLVVFVATSNPTISQTYYITSLDIASTTTSFATTSTFASGAAYNSTASRYQNCFITYYEFPPGFNESISTTLNMGGSGTVGRYKIDAYFLTGYFSATPQTVSYVDAVAASNWSATGVPYLNNAAIIVNTFISGSTSFSTVSNLVLGASQTIESTYFWSGYNVINSGSSQNFSLTPAVAGSDIYGAYAIWR